MCNWRNWQKTSSIKFQYSLLILTKSRGTVEGKGMRAGERASEWAYGRPRSSDERRSALLIYVTTARTKLKAAQRRPIIGDIGSDNVNWQCRTARARGLGCSGRQRPRNAVRRLTVPPMHACMRPPCFSLPTGLLIPTALSVFRRSWGGRDEERALTVLGQVNFERSEFSNWIPFHPTSYIF